MIRSFSSCRLRRLSAVTMIGLALIPIAALRAETVLVPFAVDGTLDGVALATRIYLTNPGKPSRRAELSFVPGAVTGPGESQPEIQLRKRQTVVVEGAGTTSSRPGLISVETTSPVAVSAQLFAPGGARPVLAALPVVDESRVRARGEEIYLQGLGRDADRRTHLGLVNASDEGVSCAIELRRPGGSRIRVPRVIVPARGFEARLDLLGQEGLSNAADLTAAIECDGPFYALALILDGARDAVEVVLPAGRPTSGGGGGSGGGGNGGGGSGAQCPSDASTCFALEGRFFTPSPAQKKKNYRIPFPDGKRFQRVDIEVTFEHGGWFSALPDGIHNIFWFNKGGRYGGSTYGFLIARGPGRNLVRNISNAFMGGGGHIKLEAFEALKPGRTYRARYSYRFGGGSKRIRCEIEELGSGKLVVSLSGPTPPNGRLVAENGGFEINFSDARVESHVPSLGWAFSDLLVAFYD